MGRGFRLGVMVGVAAVAGKTLWERPWSTTVPPSERLDAWVPGAQYRDTIALPGIHATPEQVFEALSQVTAADMPLATVVGELRYLPGRLTGKAVASSPERPFFEEIQADGSNIVLEELPNQEVVSGTVGRLHNVLDQQMVPLASPEEFRTFSEPGYEKLAMSLRVLGDDPAAGVTLVLEHRTLALDDEARRLFGLYWLGIKPGGAFVTGQLLKAVRRRAEAMGDFV